VGGADAALTDVVIWLRLIVRAVALQASSMGEGKVLSYASSGRFRVQACG
jgi:N-methylhydantoinase A/oxoprolinase/acetone carboxylase beta subunit